jgi:hypothetical protein
LLRYIPSPLLWLLVYVWAIWSSQLMRHILCTTLLAS